MSRKLIAMDLDGTAVDSCGSLRPEVKAAIGAARDAGHVAAFVSGRADTDMIPIEGDCQDVDYIILNNGAKVIRGSDHSVLYNEPLDRDGAVRLVNYCLERGLQVYVINGREWYVNRWSKRLQNYIDLLGYGPVYFDRAEQLPLDHIEGLTVMGDTGPVQSFVKEGGFGLRAVVSEEECTDILNLGTDKWRGIQKLLDLLDMAPEDVIAVGDYENDLEMICRAGTGVAVGNALDSVKARADYVTVRDNDHGAVADVINQLVLERADGLCVKTPV